MANEGTNAGATATAPEAAKPSGGGVFDDIALKDTNPLTEQSAETETPETTETIPEGQAASEGETEVTPEAEKTAEGTLPVTPKEEEKPLLAGRFKTAEELAHAYESSSIEARRLHSETLNLQKANSELRDQLEQVQLEKELGAFQVLTDEQLEALIASDDPKDRVRAQRYLIEERSFKDKKTQLERDQKKSKESVLTNQERVKTEISQTMETMKGDSKQYPNFVQYIPIMNQIFDKFGGMLGGHPLAAEAIYLIAHGITSLQTSQKASSATQADKDQAKEAALAKAKAAGSSGATHAGKAPASNTNNAELDDKAYLDKMLGTRKKGIFEV